MDLTISRQRVEGREIPGLDLLLMAGGWELLGWVAHSCWRARLKVVATGSLWVDSWGTPGLLMSPVQVGAIAVRGCETWVDTCV